MDALRRRYPEFGYSPPNGCASSDRNCRGDLNVQKIENKVDASAIHVGSVGALGRLPEVARLQTAASLRCGEIDRSFQR
jgi:hypothetical protein